MSEKEIFLLRFCITFVDFSHWHTLQLVYFQHFLINTLQRSFTKFYYFTQNIVVVVLYWGQLEQVLLELSFLDFSWTWRDFSTQLLLFITSNDRPLGCPIIYNDTNSQCYFAHWHCNNAWQNNAREFSICHVWRQLLVMLHYNYERNFRKFLHCTHVVMLVYHGCNIWASDTGYLSCRVLKTSICASCYMYVSWLHRLHR